MKIKGFTPREDQAAVLSSAARFPIIDAGRRWGKSLMGINWAIEGVCLEGGPVWWISPIWAMAKAIYRRVMTAAKKGGAINAIDEWSDSELRIVFSNGEVMEFKSGENPDTLRGEGLRRVVIDEAARIKRVVWEEVVRPAVSDTGGKVMFLSTPKGKNWFYELYTRGSDPMFPDFKAWKFPTSSNPIVPREDIEAARISLPADVFAQEYEAEFLENNAGVFRRVKERATATAKGPETGRSYFAGLDVARLTDFTVLTIIDDQGKEVHADRFNELDWSIMIDRTTRDVRRYGASLLIDSTGVGDPIFEALFKKGIAVEGYKFTAESKKRLIESLMVAFEAGEVEIFNDPVLINELEIFEYTIGRSGIVHYSAPSGYHDDMVISLALAVMNRRMNVRGPRIWT